MIVPGKTRRMGRNEGKTSTWKKAIVRLKKGEVISMFEMFNKVGVSNGC